MTRTVIRDASRIVLPAALSILAAWVFALGYLAGSWQPSCPTEDSCRADYRAGAWQIEQVTP